MTARKIAYFLRAHLVGNKICKYYLSSHLLERFCKFRKTILWNFFVEFRFPQIRILCGIFFWIPQKNSTIHKIPQIRFVEFFFHKTKLWNLQNVWIASILWKFYVVPPRGNLTVPQMKKSCVRVGSGVSVERSTPDNREKKYFKWTMETRLLLLRECRDKEVWSITHGQTVRVWADIATILRNIPTYEETFVRLTWRKCQEEFDRNLAVYTTEKEGVPFRSGSDEQHCEWHDIMDEIST